MPQMAPMPWILLMILTISTLLYITTIIFFSPKKMKNFSMKTYQKKFPMKW